MSSGALGPSTMAMLTVFPEYIAFVSIQAQGNARNGDQEGLDLVVLFSSILLFLVIVVAITLARRWR